MKSTFYYLVFIFLSLSCSDTRFHFKKYHYVKNSYPMDTVFVTNYISCYSSRNLFGKEHINAEKFNTDSLFTHFEIALKNTGLLMKINENIKNNCDSVFHSYYKMNLKKIDQEKIKNLSSRSNLTLVPFIYFHEFYRYSSYATSGGSGGGGLVKNTYLKMAIYLFKGEDLVYVRSGTHFGRDYYPDNIEEIQKGITQEKWDKLVNLVMRDYINRVEN
jgi:hypothetical protein